MRTGDLETAKRTAHTVKGVAGNLGASALQRIAGEIENCIGDEGLKEKLEMRRTELEEKLGEFVKSLQPILGGQEEKTPTAPTGDADRSRWPEVSGQLKQLLSEGDATAADVLEQERDLVIAVLGKVKASQFAEHVESFSFEEALELLDV